MMFRFALPLLLLATACATPRPEGRLDTPAAGSDRASIVQACRARAQEVLGRQDRGQLIREDERNSRLGADVVGARAGQIDQLGRQFAFDRMVDDCVRSAAAPGGPQPATVLTPRRAAP